MLSTHSVTSHNTLMTFADQLWPSSEVLSHCPLHPHELSHTCTSHHTHMTFSSYPHSDTLKPQLCSSSTIIIPCASCNLLTHIFYLKYNSLCILLCSNSDPVLIHYVISLHFVILAFSYHQPCIPILANIAVFCSSIKSLSPCMYSTCSIID